MDQTTGDEVPTTEASPAVDVDATATEAAAAVNTSATEDDGNATLADADDNLDTSAQTEPDEDRIVTMNDVLDAQKAQDLEYAAVLGGSDQKSCTYATVRGDSHTNKLSL